MSSLPKVIRVSAIPIKIPVAFFIGKFFFNPNIFTDSQKAQIIKAILSKKNKARGIIAPYFRLLQSYGNQNSTVLI